MRPLDGLVVLDLTRLLPGASATMLLANFGAEVVKIEQPGTGDYARHMPPLVDGEGAVFRAVNRGKKSVTLDLKNPADAARFREMAATADVLIEGNRPGVMQRLGLDYDALRPANPGLIFVSLTGYGQDGPYAPLAGHDINYLALGGLLDLTGEANGPPSIPAAQIADLAGGAMQAVIGVLLALAARHKTGQGQLVDVGMIDGVASLLVLPLAIQAATGRAVRRGETTLSGYYACYHVYRAADGRWLAVGALEPKFWQIVCEQLGCPQFLADQFADGARRREIVETVSRIFAGRSSAQWLVRFSGADACVTLVQSLEEVAADPHLRARESIVNLDGAPAPGVIPKLRGTPGRIGGPPPRLGEHNR
jgi:crotonobetainyl-CoA:carnitine CoA-transferase CaiB-like acyl-CoA transferase